MMTLMTYGSGVSRVDPGHNRGVSLEVLRQHLETKSGSVTVTRRPGLTHSEFVLMSNVE